MKNSLNIEEGRANVDEMSTRNTWQVVQTVFNVLNHAMIIIVAVYMTRLTYLAGNQAISWHVFLCTVGVSVTNIFYFNSSNNQY